MSVILEHLLVSMVVYTAVIVVSMNFIKDGIDTAPITLVGAPVAAVLATVLWGLFV